MTGLPTDATDLLHAALHHPEGVDPLFEAQLECAAALYQVRPERVEAVRALLVGERRAEALEAARRRTPRKVEAHHKAAQVDAQALIAQAAARADGLEWLQHAPPERAATYFGVSVYLIEEARQLLARS